jgi:hypothetical protein
MTSRRKQSTNPSQSIIETKLSFICGQAITQLSVIFLVHHNTDQRLLIRNISIQPTTWLTILPSLISWLFGDAISSATLGAKGNTG